MKPRVFCLMHKPRQDNREREIQGSIPLELHNATGLKGIASTGRRVQKMVCTKVVL